MTAEEQRVSMDQLIEALNSAEPAVFAIMDYWTFDGWLALRRRLAEPGAPPLKKTVFPGIELRLVSPTKYRLNAHVVFSDKTTDQELQDFKSRLEVALIEQPLSRECLIKLAREKLGTDLLKPKGFTFAGVQGDEQVACTAGSHCAEITAESYKDAIAKVPAGKAIGFMPWDTNDGLEHADWRTHYAYVIGLMKASPIFETRNLEQWAAFAGVKTPGNSSWLEAFQAALGNVPRLAVCGSDAHAFAKYGVFPSGKATWLKADPTFLGLLQAIKEPAKRSFIGDVPPKLVDVTQNKTFYIDSISVQRVTGPKSNDLDPAWLDGCSLPLNPDLVAIIGNKGSGKSALADVIAVLGNSRQTAHFTFLKKDRFRGKSGEPAKNFIGALTWRDKTTVERNLADDPPPDSVEMVRYIPQGHFEELCNEHVSGRTNAFERELRAVIFSHADDSIRQGALDFDQLIVQQESNFRDKLGELRKDLRKLNFEISAIEDQLAPQVKRSLAELLTQKARQLEEHVKVIPAEVFKPSEQLDQAQAHASKMLEGITSELKILGERAQARTAASQTLARRQRAVQTLRERARLLERAYKQFADDAGGDFSALGLKPSDVASLTINSTRLDEVQSELTEERSALDVTESQDSERRAALQDQQRVESAKLNEPQLRYQAYLEQRSTWEAKQRELTGTPQSPDTLEGLRARIAQLDQLPTVLEEKRKARLTLTGEIYDTLEEQRSARAALFKPVQDLIQGNALIRDEYKLQFRAFLGASPEAIAESLFVLVKQNTGEFRGEDESVAAIKRLADQYGLIARQGVLDFVTHLDDRMANASASVAPGTVGISSILRKDKVAVDAYDLLFGLTFLQPRYSLVFQDTLIEQLSPGQRGALLLIFYLLVDKGHNPIILDQPEENLDNETVVSLLVPVVNEAKKRRQIIMVTHNPNLAVVCDAEQIIHSVFDRKCGCKIEYRSGSIESSPMNHEVVNVLEGTKPAFDNRRGKYH